MKNNTHKDLREKIEKIIDDYANYVYYEGDPMRGGINKKEAIKNIEALLTSDTPKDKPVKEFYGYDFGKDDLSCLVKGRKLKNGKIKIEKIEYSEPVKVEGKDWEDLLSKVRLEEKEKTADDICILIDIIESQSKTNTLEEWRQYKGIRNAIRDKYKLVKSIKK